MCGGNGEIVGAIITHENFDMGIINESFDSMGKRSMAYLPANAVKSNIDPTKQPKSEVQRYNWNIATIHLYRVTKDEYPDGDVDCERVINAEAIFLPEPYEYRIESQTDFER